MPLGSVYGLERQIAPSCQLVAVAGRKAARGDRRLMAESGPSERRPTQRDRTAPESALVRSKRGVLSSLRRVDRGK